MRRWALMLGLFVAAGSLATGCKSKQAVSITITPSTATVLVGTTAQFIATVSNGGAVTWSVEGTVNGSSTSTVGGNTTVGTVSTNGLYTAPLTVPANTTITVIATLQSDSSVTGSATVTLDSGVRVNITPSSFTLGTGETLQFTATVTGVPPNASITGICNADSAPPSPLPYCNTVTWSITPTTGAGSIDTNGHFVASGTQTTAVVEATSIFDTNRSGSASVSIVQATPPTISSISPSTAARGGLFQDVYLTGTNFLSTTTVYVADPVNGTRQIPATDVIVPQPGLTITPGSTVGTLMHVRLPDSFLATPPVPPATVATLTFTVQEQNVNTPIGCTSGAAACQLQLVAVRPAVVGTSPDSIPQGTGVPVAFNVNGGYFGTTQTPAVTATFGGNETKFPIVSSANSTRQMTVTIGGTGSSGDVSTPGLFPIAISSNVNPAASVVTNIAIQPSYPASTINSVVQFTGGNVGASPAAVAINTTTGMAAVANKGSNDIELIDLTQTTPVVKGFICTAGVTFGPPLPMTETNSCAAAGPVSVAVDNVSNMALVANAATSTIAVVDLNQEKVTAVVPVPTNNNLTPPAPFVPTSVGINPLNHRALVSYQSTNVASILDLTQTPTSPPSGQSSQLSPFWAGIVNVSTGPNARVAVSPRLDWALVTPGGLGSLSIVDLARQSTSTIATTGGASRSSGIATITTTSAQNLQVGEPVQISGVSDPSFNGLYTVLTVPSSTTFTYSQTNIANLSNSNSGGGTISYATPVATLASSLTTQGVAFNDQTQKAILTDPAGTNPGTVFTVLDQSSTSISLPTTNTSDGSFNLAVAVNPLANLAITANQNTGDAFVVDPSTPAVLTTISAEGVDPVDAAIDPGTDIVVFANQGPPASVSIYSLGALRPLQVLEASVAPTTKPQPGCPANPAPIFAGPTVLVCPPTSGPSGAVEQTITIIGSGFTPNSTPRLDGQALSKNFVSSRELQAFVDPSYQSVPRRYSLDVADSGVVSNSMSFTVAQSVNIQPGEGGNNACITPSPQGVAIDPQLHEAVVTDAGLGCNQVYLIDLSQGTILSGGVIETSTTPVGVATFPRLGLAVVANQGANTASVITEVPGSSSANTSNVLATVTLDSGPTGVAIDQDLNEVLVTAFTANVADEFTLTGSDSAATAGSSSSLTTQQGPTAVAIDSVTHLAAVGNVTTGNVTVLSLSQTTATATTPSILIPQGITLDPCPASTCNANEEFLPNPNFLITASLQNQVDSLDPTTGTVTPFRVGINPTALAYNVAASTLVTLNSLSQTMTVVDYLGRQVRAVFPITPSSQFGVDIDPQMNMAVVADPTNSRVLLLPLPY